MSSGFYFSARLSFIEDTRDRGGNGNGNSIRIEIALHTRNAVLLFCFLFPFSGNKESKEIGKQNKK